MKILDRYISSSLAGTFLFGVAMFMALFMAANLLQKFIEMVAEQGVPLGIALLIFLFRTPNYLALTFPMSVLLSIMLVFSRMSSDSEMVAIRAGGISFVRIVIPTLFFAAVVTLVTFFIADYVVPRAGQRALVLEQTALSRTKVKNPVQMMHIDEEGEMVYSFTAESFDYNRGELNNLCMNFFEQHRLVAVLSAKVARWDAKAGQWRCEVPTVLFNNTSGPNFSLESAARKGAQLTVEAPEFQLQESPFDINTARKHPEDLSANDMRHYIQRLAQMGKQVDEKNRWSVELANRYAVPFASLVFALIGAALGLRSHRTSSSMGLGISVLVIFCYYILFHYMSVFGENGRMSPTLAAWVPNIAGAVVGVILVARANR